MAKDEIKERRSVWEMYNTSRQKQEGLDYGQIVSVDGLVKIIYKQNLGGVVSSGSMKDELKINGNIYEARYRLKSIVLVVYDPLKVTPPDVVKRNLEKYPKGVFKRV